MKKFLKLAEKDANYVQINVAESQDKSIAIKNNNIDEFENSLSKDCTVKVWIDGKEGVSSGNKLDSELVKRAIKIAKLNKKKEYFYGLPVIDKYPKIKNFDQRLVDLKEEVLVTEAKKIIKDCKDVTISSAKIECSHDKEFVLNSNGVDVFDESTTYGLGISTVINKNGKISTWWDDKESNHFFKLRDFASKVNDKTLFYLGQQKLKSKPKTVTLNPEVFSQLCNYSLLRNFNGKDVLNHKSLFIDKLGTKIMDESVSIIDNGLKGINAFSFDDEGTKSQKTSLVKNGVLKNFIYDHNTALHAKTKSTGNSVSSDISFSNVYIDANKGEKDGLYVESIMGAHTGNPITTDFSVKVEHAILNDKPIKDLMISGKVIELMNNMLIDKNIVYRNGMYVGNVISNKINVIF